MEEEVSTVPASSEALRAVMDPNQRVRRPVLDSDSDAPLMPARIEGSDLIAEVARREHGGIQSRSDHVPVVAMDVNDSESEVSMGTALEQDCVKAAWLRRWSCILACRAFALSLLERRPNPGTGVDIPSEEEVMRDDRFG